MARKHRVEVRLSFQEHQILDEYAGKFGMTHSEAVRRLIHQLWIIVIVLDTIRTTR